MHKQRKIITFAKIHSNKQQSYTWTIICSRFDWRWLISAQLRVGWRHGSGTLADHLCRCPQWTNLDPGTLAAPPNLCCWRMPSRWWATTLKQMHCIGIRGWVKFHRKIFYYSLFTNLYIHSLSKLLNYMNVASQNPTLFRIHFRRH